MMVQRQETLSRNDETILKPGEEVSRMALEGTAD